MDSIKSISKPKSRLLLFILTALISVITISLFQNPLKVYAADDYASWAASIVDSVGSGGSGGTNTVRNGVMYTRTGYLTYLLTADGQKVSGTNAIAFHSPNYNEIAGSKFIAVSRQGGYTATSFNGGQCPWNCTPWTEGGASTNEPTIKSWFEAMDSTGGQNAVQFVFKHFGEAAAAKYYSGDYIIVVETIMNFQYSLTQSSETDQYEVAIAQVNAMTTEEILAQAYIHGMTSLIESYEEVPSGTAKEQIIDQAKYALVAQIKTLKLSAGGTTGKYTLVGDPVIGTVPNLLKYKSDLGIDSKVFDSYTNKVAPFAERIDVGGAGQRAGFQPWTGSTSSQISDQQVRDFGVAMMVISAVDGGQTTYDESKLTTPAKPADESDGTCTIIKSYRERLADGSVVDHGTFYLKQLANNITIEDEPTFTVVGWKTSTTEKINISSLTWESSVPSLVGDQGDTPTSVTLPDSHKYLYVLLEKTQEGITEEPDANYTLTQSTIARHITLNNPDSWTAGTTMTKLSTLQFTWTLPKVGTCDGHTGYCGGCYCGGHPGHSHTGASGSCYGYVCGSNHAGTALVDHTFTDSCWGLTCTQSTGTTYCSSLSSCTNKKCDGHTEKCTWGTLVDATVQRGLKRTNTSNYQRIIASNTDVNYNKVTKNNALWMPTSNRTSLNAQTLSTSGFDFHTILHRGDTQIVIADWKSPAASKTFLGSVSPSYNYTIANSITGTRANRKTENYTASFTVTIGDNSKDSKTSAKINAGTNYGSCNTQTVSMSLNETKSVSATAKVQVYLGKAISPNTAINPNPQSDTIGNIQVSGIMVKSGSVTGFRPYVQMKYDTLDTLNQPNLAYVLGEHDRSLYLNSYAEIEWNKQPTPNLTLSSLQWSTHNEANKNHSPGTVLPGGATLTLSIRENHRQTVKVHTYQPVLEGAGRAQVSNTGGDTTKIATASQALDAHNTFVESVRTNLDSLHLQQWFVNADYATNPGGDRTTSKDVFNNGGKVDNNIAFSGFGGSEETKYYFDNDTSTGGINGASNEGDLDAKTGTTTTRYYLFWCDPSGNIRMLTGTTPDIATWVPDGKF